MVNSPTTISRKIVNLSQSVHRIPLATGPRETYVLGCLHQTKENLNSMIEGEVFSLCGCEQGMLLAKHSVYKCCCKQSGDMRKKKKNQPGSLMTLS